MYYSYTPVPHLLVFYAALDKRPHISIFGTDYPTPDGTAIRDYIHVRDLGAAHIKALEYLRRGGASQRLNLGTGRGYSVKEVVEAVERVTGRKVPVKLEPRRAGDPARLVAQAEQARQVLGWKPEFSDLETIVRTAWEWHRAQPNGYEK